MNITNDDTTIFRWSKPYKKYFTTITDKKTYIKHVIALYSGDNTQPYGYQIINTEVKNGKVRCNPLELLKILSNNIEENE